MSAKSRKKLFFRFTEALSAFVLVLCFFLTFVWILGISFPAGASLKDLVESQELPGLAGVGGMEFDLPPDEDEEQAERVPGYRGKSFIAELTKVKRKVKEKPRNRFVWGEARIGQALRQRHAVQTLSRSSATIWFEKTYELNLGPNSLIIVKSLEEHDGTGERRTTLVLLEGELSSRVDTGGTGVMRLDVQTTDVDTTDGKKPTTSTITLTPQADQPVDFKINVEKDKAATLSVYEGKAEITAKGETIVVKPNQAVTVSADGKSVKRVTLPGPPTLDRPKDGWEKKKRTATFPVRFRWNEPENADGYRVVVATDAAFEEVVYDERVEKPELRHGELSAGKYYWRVSAMNGAGEGRPSTSRSIRLIQDNVAPPLEVDLVDGTVNTDRIEVRGRTEPGARILVSDQDVEVSENGEFTYWVSLNRGLNVVVIEAWDEAGNTSYASKTLKAKY